MELFWNSYSIINVNEIWYEWKPELKYEVAQLDEGWWEELLFGPQIGHNGIKSLK